MSNFATILVTGAILIGQTDNEKKQLPPGKEKIQDLAFLIGTWQQVEDENRTSTFRWINNHSYIELVAGNYRELIGWDIVHERIVSWCFGTDGGQGRALWTQEDGKWTVVRKSFLDRWGNPLPPAIFVIDLIDENTHKTIKKSLDGQVQSVNTYKRMRAEDSPDNGADRTANGGQQDF
ncbi:MAG: hypothetical protein R6U98_30435 [Pirellulaceae bacterium]